MRYTRYLGEGDSKGHQTVNEAKPYGDDIQMTTNLFQTYYGLAIRRGVKSVEEMKRNIWATYFHKLLANTNRGMHCVLQERIYGVATTRRQLKIRMMTIKTAYLVM